MHTIKQLNIYGSCQQLLTTYVCQEIYHNLCFSALMLASLLFNFINFSSTFMWCKPTVHWTCCSMSLLMTIHCIACTVSLLIYMTQATEGTADSEYCKQQDTQYSTNLHHTYTCQKSAKLKPMTMLN